MMPSFSSSWTRYYLCSLAQLEIASNPYFFARYAAGQSL
jgi:hypothetical protein